MADEEKNELLKKVFAENPLAAQMYKIAFEGMQELRDSLVADGITGTINGVPFGPKRKDQ